MPSIAEPPEKVAADITASLQSSMRTRWPPSISKLRGRKDGVEPLQIE
jgi:hypothetical protein